MGGTAMVIGAAVLCLGLLPGTAGAADVTILGCSERNPGEIGTAAVVADIGDTVGVPISVHTVAPVDAFQLELHFPLSLLSHVRTDPGSLTGGTWLVSGTYISSQSLVRVGGFDLTPIPADSVGTLAVVQFVVTAAGTDSFSTSNYVDDVATYTACESVNAPTSVEPEAWGRVKALYR